MGDLLRLSPWSKAQAGNFFLARLAHSSETDFRVLGFYVVWLPRF